VYTKNAGEDEGESTEANMTAAQEALSSQQTTSTFVFTPGSFLESSVSDDPASQQSVVYGGSGPASQHSIHSQTSNVPETPLSRQGTVCQGSVCESPSTSSQRESSLESSGRHERGEDEYAENTPVGGDVTGWAESTAGDYSVQGASDNEDSDVSLTTMYSRLQKLVYDHVDNEAGLVIVDFESNDGRQMKEKLLVRSSSHCLPALNEPVPEVCVLCTIV
jgi:hypothetical protein